MEENVNSLASTAFTRVKNHYEALRSNIVNSRSSEYRIACCGCCSKNESDTIPNIYTNGSTENPPKLVWSQKNYKFLEYCYNPNDDNDANGHLRVHPTLWENGASNHLSGVFEVVPNRIYQVRGYDMSNLTFVRSNPPKENCSDNEAPRWIVFDTLMSKECTQAAMDLFENFLQTELLKDSNYCLKGSIIGMIISHSHIDHYGGMDIVKDYFISEEKAKGIKGLSRFILAPAGFYDHAVSENVYLGNAMGRRASYQYGSFIKPQYVDENSDINKYTNGEISIGIGQGQSTGTPSAVGRPTKEITENDKQPIEMDGINVDFQLTPGTEAPAEMNNYIHEYNALWLAENCSGTLHNLYTLRGAEIRDAKAWSHFLMEAAVKYGGKTDVIFQSHNWPHRKEDLAKEDESKQDDCIRDFIIETAAIYKYIHDQTLLYMNMGYKMNEVADMLVLPRAMQKNWTLKPFYGTPVHNAKAVYQKYLGWYDANPIHLQELPPEQLAKETLRYVMAGSKEKMKAMIEDDIAKGNYWTAAYMANQMILSGECENEAKEIKELCASALQQLGYQCESGTWRNAYLSAAFELRNHKVRSASGKSDQLAQMPPETLLDYISIFFDGERAAAKVNCDIGLDVQNTDDAGNVVNETYFSFVVKNGAILYYEISAETYSKCKNNEVVSLNELKEVANGSYTGNCKILGYISNAMVVVANKDRFKLFDIIGRHDCEVQTMNYGKVDLKTEAKNCIALLEEYVSTSPDSSRVQNFTDENKTKWDRFYEILKTETMVILDDDFFVPGHNDQGIGKDAKFMDYELYYTLYSLYRYLYRSYLKNDYGYMKCNFDEKAFAKLKQGIVLLETYVADFYLCNSRSSVNLDIGDSNAWRYLHDEAASDTQVSFRADEFFFQLYTLYKALSSEANCVRKFLTRIP